MAEFETVGADDQKVLRELAVEVTDALVLAGLPLARRDDSVDVAGVDVEIDFGADSAGGLFLRWRTSSSLRDKTGDALLRGDLEDPSLAHSFAISEAMKTALKSILASSGFLGEDAEQDTRPASIRVRGRAA